MLAEAIAPAATPAADAEGQLVRLSQTRPGDAGVIVDVRAESHPGDHGVGLEELQRRLLEFGFVEGAELEVLHEGAIRRDPIAVRLDNMRIALRRRDAEDVWVLLARGPTRRAQ
ncbi:ferrous iron transport protein A [Phenylobacterium deserti]|uniref:Ferrous iron transport protein A n=2 Tax=Phenylobacterium deserti TaxID=1914756 RepID=A0A328AT80_9CAUL|nr:FeoA family protein [Phenylobacterium deserti]RAK58160.1 ferrous iron transport protein A [Phenylobacterium deserti]